MARPRRARIVIRSAGAIEYRINLIDYGATWKYKIDAHDHSPGFEDPGYDDSLWSTAPAAFGHVIDGEQAQGANFPPCVQNREIIATEWAIVTDLCLRKTITIPANATRVYFEFGIDNISTMYLDGVEVAETTNSGCQTRGSQSFWLDSPPTGDVVLAIRCRDPHPTYDTAPYTFDDTFFDLKLDVVGPDAPTYVSGNFLIGKTLIASGSGAAFVWINPQNANDGNISSGAPEAVINNNVGFGAQYGRLAVDLGASVTIEQSAVIFKGAITQNGTGSGSLYVYSSAVGTSGPWTLRATHGHYGETDEEEIKTVDVNFTAQYWMLEWAGTLSGFYQGMGLREWQLNGFSGASSELGFQALAGRGPGAVVAIIEDFQNGGVSKFHNSGGELFFTLKNDHPQIGTILPWQTHWVFEEFRGEGWTELNWGWIDDYDTAPDETIFYGIDYLGVLALLKDERFNPEQAPDRAALLYPDDATGTGGSKYVDETIHNIIADQIDRAIYSGNSELGFMTRGAVATMDEQVTIFCTLEERLAFMAGLIDSHRAGTGKKTRLQSTMTRTWIDARTWTPAYKLEVFDDPGEDRPDITLEYGRMLNGYRVIPFGEFATRVLGVGKTSTGFRLEFHIEPTPPPDGEDPNFNEITFGRLNKVNFWDNIVDLNDLRRRSRQLAGAVGAIGKQMGLALRVDGLGVEDGWDICDSVPVIIQRGPLDTTTMGGGGYWTIWGWSAIYRANGYSEMVLSVLPKAPEQALPNGWDTSSVTDVPDNVEVHDGPPDPASSPGNTNTTWIDSSTGHIWTVDPETGQWVDRTEAGDFDALATLITIEDEGVPLATTASTLDFVGDGVVASGITAEKTITIDGVPKGPAGGDLEGTYPNPTINPDAIRDRGHWEVIMVIGVTSPPDPLQTIAGDDWVYGWVEP